MTTKKATKEVERDDDLLVEVAADISVANSVAEELFGDKTTVAMVEQIYSFLALYEDDRDQLTEDMHTATEASKEVMGKRGGEPEAILFVFRSQFIDTLDEDEAGAKDEDEDEKE